MVRTGTSGTHFGMGGMGGGGSAGRSVALPGRAFPERILPRWIFGLGEESFSESPTGGFGFALGRRSEQDLGGLPGRARSEQDLGGLPGRARSEATGSRADERVGRGAPSVTEMVNGERVGRYDFTTKSRSAQLCAFKQGCAARARSVSGSRDPLDQPV